MVKTCHCITGCQSGLEDLVDSGTCSELSLRREDPGVTPIPGLEEFTTKQSLSPGKKGKASLTPMGG
jgi:hypothetical protein